MSLDLVLLDKSRAEGIALLLVARLKHIYSLGYSNDHLFEPEYFEHIKEYVVAIRSLSCGHLIPQEITQYVIDNM